MPVFKQSTNPAFAAFTSQGESIIADLSPMAKEGDIAGIRKLLANFQAKTEDFFRENRKLNIGVVGQVKAGKSSFLNTLLFGGQEILPKASTPKTATLTKMEYAETNVINVEYYTLDEWSVLEDNAQVDLDDEVYTSARELVNMARRNGVDPQQLLSKGSESIEFATYADLLANLNNYVGEDGKYTPLVKAVTLYLNKEEFKGLSIVDTPGLNDPIASRTIRTKEFMEVCDVVFFLSQSGSFLDKSDWILLSSQLPQKGVKRLVLIASKYDSGIRDILRVEDEDDIFGDDDNTADNIPKACKIIRRKLKKRAKEKVAEFVADLERRGSSPALISVIQQCSEPLMVSALAQNMSGKSVAELTPEEKNVYTALKRFSRDMEADLQLLGNFAEVRRLFSDVVAEKEAILEEKAKGFVPNAQEELKNLLRSYLEKTDKTVQLLQGRDRDQLLEQKKFVEKQINSVKADVTAVFGDLNNRLETEKLAAIQEIRRGSQDYLTITDHTGTRSVERSRRVSDSKWYKPWTWGTSHREYYTTHESYSYCLASDAIENIRKYGLEASNQVETVFTEAVQLKEIKRRLLNVIVTNLDLGSDKYDASLFRLMVEETVNSLEFPVISIDISDAINSVAGRFNGEITSSGQRTELAAALSNAIARILESLCSRLDSEVRKYKGEMAAAGHKAEEAILTNISQEFAELLQLFQNKEQEIADLKRYAQALQGAMRKV